MKTELLKNYGVSGKKVVFNLMDCYEASHTQDRIACLQNAYEHNEAHLSHDDVVEAMTILNNIRFLLDKIALKPDEMPNIFLPEEDEPVKEKECCK